MATNKAKWVHARNKKHQDVLGRTKDIDVINKVINTPEKLEAVVDGGITSVLAGQLSRAIQATDTDPATDPVATKVVDEGETSVTLDIAETQVGLYMAIVDPADKTTVYNPVFASADYNLGGTNAFNVPLSSSSYSDKAAAKKSKLDLEKEAENDDDYNEDGGDTAAVGDELTFTVTTTIPGYGETFVKPQFILKDAMTENLELDPDSVTVVEPEGAVVTIVGKTGIGTADKTGYGIVFDSDYLKGLKAATPVKITYNATVVKTTPQSNVDKETNTVTIEYSHDPSTETDEKPGGDKEYQKDITNHYTFSIDADSLWKDEGRVGESGSEIIKIAVDRDGTPIMSEKTYSNITDGEYEQSPLAGCKFELYKVDADGKKTGKPIEAESDAAGRIKFEGLDAGEYILVETEAPAGYVKDNTEYPIVITAVTEEKSYTEYYDQDGNWYESEDDPDIPDGTTVKPYTYTAEELVSYSITFDGAEVASHTFVHESGNNEIKWSKDSSKEAPASIHNTKGVELPSTGGMGTRLFYIIGAILVVGAGVLLVTRRRMNAN